MFIFFQKNSLKSMTYSGAGEMNRTPDLLITNELLYRLSYTGIPARDYSQGAV